MTESFLKRRVEFLESQIRKMRDANDRIQEALVVYARYDSWNHGVLEWQLNYNRTNQ